MTKLKEEKMTDKEMVKTICGHLGWTQIRKALDYKNQSEEYYEGVKPGYPDYPNPAKYPLPDITLDWMHEIEWKEIRSKPMETGWYPYCRLLHVITNGLGEGATAMQRGEAFLRWLAQQKDPQ